VRRLILKIHLVLGLSAGAFSVVLGVTGSIIAFEPELDRLLHSHLSYVSPGSRLLPLVEIGKAVSNEYPGEPIVAYLLPECAEFPTQVSLSRGIVSVNQYTGQILGVRTRGQSLLGAVRPLHVRLAMGDVGRAILKWSAVAMLFSVASGVYLWWPGKRMRIRRQWWTLGFWFDLHNVVGIVSLLPLVALTATGVVIGFEDQIAPLLDKRSGVPAIAAHPAITPPSLAKAVEITPDQAVAIAIGKVPGTYAHRIQMPEFGGAYRVSLEYTDHRIAGDRNLISIDPENGEIVSASLMRDLSFRDRLMAVNETIHTGSIFGMPTKIVAALASILVPVQALTGWLIWLRKRKIGAK